MGASRSACQNGAVPDLRALIETFVASAELPAMLDPGEEPLPLVAEQWDLSEWNGRLVLQAWDRKRNLVRRITGLKEQQRHRLCLTTERFRNAQADLQIADLGAPGGRDLGRRTSRIAFCERLRLMLAREWPEWRIEDISAEANLEESLTPSFARAFLRTGSSSGMAVMAAQPETAGAGGIVAAGLIWLDYLRRREKTCAIGRLLLYVPLGMERDAAFRAGCLDPAKVDCRLFGFDERDRAGAIDPADIGNIDSTLPPCRRPLVPNAERGDLPEMPDVDAIEQTDGSLSLRVRGLEFARVSAGKISCGIGRRRRSTIETARAMGREIARVRCAENSDRMHPFYSLNPEGWIESRVRANPQAIDASLRAAPIYGQVPVFSGADRGVIDLLGIDRAGRLVVIEIKAAADPQLPFQALDYWLRVRKHLDAGDFARQGYFAGHVVSPEAPRIILLAPALEFHSTTETLLGALDPKIDVMRIGLAADWRSELRVMFRLRGSERP
jgi:hypothetical protein